MNYLIMVSHGQFASGLKNALTMLVGDKEECLAIGLEDGKGIDDFTVLMKEAIRDIHPEDAIVLAGDLIGGSPLTTAMNILSEYGLSQNLVVIGGMNLPLVLTTALMKDTYHGQELVDQVLQEASAGLRQFSFVVDEEDDI
ncbi:MULTISPECIES: PTS fructose transporter subunit IIA [unclassified Breznakia]|uniref:PTS sugar transporter subunit IIA n=1 Tax=unclassified Breznakia TaxID=2623764 RepID=UPI00247343E0|nr:MULTISPECIES: PTS fructose transporter subunit IIA [unclassified Breznakia]MDH6367656.1 PTS system N-acetylgalactosamine-specific IIA component [Breznakia sp. PH1-1]MDH6404751.1 PTS system N-acetylgalactosamine-specific IIA component [Breznakia sp. PF1-11]MDH6412466.1 PTS system N-acetylgalactosamine-specific IIA component [Breznakia sp. PFB1-11]MDH6414826.1 PTS system N-acetylgalactosamine-specific IIA component [Breznakia sp. PFB1-14]MDH6417130.1 PTS system N-acetylgalactosamine-specific 